MPVVLIAGGTGLVGTALSEVLTRKGYEVLILTRGEPGPARLQWDPEKRILPADAVGKADYIVNLTGAGVADKRWSKKRKQEIVSSRVDSAALIARALATQPNHVKAVVQASAIGWYGDDGRLGEERAFSEDTGAALDFFGQTCLAWEKAIAPVAESGRRLVTLRVGLVLDKNGGAFKAFAGPVRWGIAAIMGSGTQMQSWIHIQDLCRIIVFALENAGLSGVYNAVAPNPVSNRTLVLQMAQQIKGSFFIPVNVPPFMLRMVVGEMANELLKSLTVSCERLKKAGFQFVFPSVESALQALTATTGSK